MKMVVQKNVPGNPGISWKLSSRCANRNMQHEDKQTYGKKK
jgi:hypothetical protein